MRALAAVLRAAAAAAMSAVLAGCVLGDNRPGHRDPSLFGGSGSRSTSRTGYSVSYYRPAWERQSSYNVRRYRSPCRPGFTPTNYRGTPLCYRCPGYTRLRWVGSQLMCGPP